MSNRERTSNDYDELNERYTSSTNIHNYNHYDNQFYMPQDRQLSENHRNREYIQHFARMNDGDDDYILEQYRTTSIHRNASNRIGDKPRRLEENRRWVRSSSKYNFQFVN